MYDLTKTPPPVMMQKPTSRRASVVASTALVILSLLIILGSGFLIFYATILHPRELKIQATAVANTILTNQAQAKSINSPQSLYTQFTNKAPTFNNSMDAPMGGWDTGNIGNSSCTFTGGAYHIHVASDHIYFACLNTAKNYSNFVFQVQMTILNGSAGGLLLRSSLLVIEGYSFLSTNNGLYNTGVITNKIADGENILEFGRDATLQTGLKQPELLTVIARSNHFMFYINKQFISSFDDSTFSTGLISLIAVNPEGRNDIDVAFNNAQLWVL